MDKSTKQNHKAGMNLKGHEAKTRYKKVEKVYDYCKSRTSLQ